MKNHPQVERKPCRLRSTGVEVLPHDPRGADVVWAKALLPANGRQIAEPQDV